MKWTELIQNSEVEMTFQGKNMKQMIAFWELF